jgi:hypothetical protein
LSGKVSRRLAEETAKEATTNRAKVFIFAKECKKKLVKNKIKLTGRKQ